MRTRGPQSGYRSTIPLRRKLRHEATTAEKLFWTAVARRQLLGLKFRQQHGIGPYIADFYCPQKKLIIEIDGNTHFQNGVRERDASRTKYLQSLGYTVTRYTNADIMHNLAGVIEDLLRYISEDPSNSPARGGEKQE